MLCQNQIQTEMYLLSYSLFNFRYIFSFFYNRNNIFIFSSETFWRLFLVKKKGLDLFDARYTTNTYWISLVTKLVSWQVLFSANWLLEKCFDLHHWAAIW